MSTKKIFVRNDAVPDGPVKPKPTSPRVVSASPGPRETGLLSPAKMVMLVWACVMLVPWLLQIRSYIQLVTPHKISLDLLAHSADYNDTEVAENCPVQGMRIAGVWWNVWPTGFYSTGSGRICRYVFPQYNMHGAYRIYTDGSIETMSPPTAPVCTGKVYPLTYYFYHGSFGYCSFYEEGEGTYCTDELTANLIVNKLGSIDLNGARLANDLGDTHYRQSYWFGCIGLIWIIYRALVIRRSYILFTRYVERNLAWRRTIRLRDAAIYIQEIGRLSAHGAHQYHRAGLLYLLVEGVMADLFLIVTKDGFVAQIQCVSLGYNLAGALSIIFEMIESCKCMRHRTRTLKRLFFNQETTLIGELGLMTVFQMFLTSLNHSQLKDSLPVALAVSYYLWGLIGHLFFVIGVTVFLLSVRALGAIGSVWWKYRSLKPLFAPCCVDDALGRRAKFIVLTGYSWNHNKLYYMKDTLAAFGLMRTVDAGDGEVLLVHEKIHWFSAPKSGLVAIGKISGTHVEPIDDQPCSSPISACDRVLGGRIIGQLDSESAQSDGDTEGLLIQMESSEVSAEVDGGIEPSA